ncbi:glycosyl transferase family 90-domain-containing protein [Mycena rosella]|uniref:Glycosyl transferase family 90-domain-containing protein n=1 Tax=Mycena rosella TaxID=1033263 RepID=A0AAD7GDM4_MYCRO|nr:glycosyl transferase family 90-domain-containing protein [Mycena rosella]
MNYLKIFRNPHMRAKEQSPFDDADDADDSTIPLLPVRNSNHEQKSEGPAGGRRCKCERGVLRGWGRCAATTASILGIISGTAILTPILTGVFTDPANPAHIVDALYARQSTTLAQATARYALHTGRAPPPGYARWFEFARQRQCLVDEYDQIRRDFKAFYQLADADPAYFQDMIDHAARELTDAPVEITRVEVVDGEVYLAGDSAYGGYWPDTLRHVSGYLPNMTFFMNGLDEPRVAFNYRAPGARDAALAGPTDFNPFWIEPHPTANFFANRSGCTVPLEANGLMSSANGDSSFLLSSAKPGFTTDLYPMLSMTKISPCFSDILFPTEYYYERSWWGAHYSRPDDVPWEQKKPQIYWRGMSNGGMIIGENYHHFVRFKLIDVGREHPDLMNVAITTFAETLCEEGCDREAIMAEYNITGDGEPREDLYGYKYAIDVDGTTFSGRFLGLLKSGSLVFKSTLFEEYFNDWIRPFEHYVPVLPDLSDLVEKIEWANANPEEARLIQQRGLEMARRVLTDDQNDCYFFAVLLEWARLQDYAKGVSA